MTEVPSPDLIDRAAALLGWTPEGWRRVVGGYTPAARYVAWRGGERAFVKIATTPLTLRMLRREADAYQHVRGPFMPRLVGWSDDESQPMLIIEDLAGARWPPPWDRPSVDAVLESLDQVHACKADLKPRRSALNAGPRNWEAVAADPAPFLSLGMASPEWLTRALPRLIAAEAACVITGDRLVHFDLRSDNMCFSSAGVKFIDWAEARAGNPKLDLGFWLPSLAFEGGPAPDDVLPNAPEIAAWVSGFFAALAGLPIIPDAPFVRRVQCEQLSTALPWAQRALKLDPL